MLIFLDVSSQANVLLMNLKQIVDKLQCENTYFKTQVKKLTVEKKHLLDLNKNLTNKVGMLEKDMRRKIVL